MVGVEPDPTLLPLARSRPGGATVHAGSAEHVPFPDASVDVVHARAYFFPPGCDAGLAEVLRVLRPGGALVVVDTTATGSSPTCWPPAPGPPTRAPLTPPTRGGVSAVLSGRR